jgi:NADPH:quinone reductase-like Zn-dependent oxidoreductase
MRALVASATPPHAELVQLPDPRPAADEALVEVRAFSLNRGETRMLSMRAPGTVAGWDVAGDVRAAAADGSGPPPGARVVGMMPARGGGWAELAAVRTEMLAQLPDGISFEQASTLPIAGLTALRALEVAGLLLGKQVLVTGATGGVGRMAIQLAQASGADVTALVRDAAASDELLRHLGATHVTEQITGDFDLILDGVGGATFGLAIEHVVARGVVVNIATQSDDETVSFHAARFDRAKGARIYTFDLRDELASHASASGDLTRLCRLMADGRLNGQIELESSWRDASDALNALLERRIGGKAVLHID